MADAENRSAGQLSFEELPLNAPKVFSVGELVRIAAAQLAAQFSDVWVEGEVSNLRRPSSGHCYFTLKDSAAQLAVVMFRSAVDRLPFQIEDGQQLRCGGRLTIYEVQGRFQLSADRAEPIGVGALQVAFEQLKRKLATEGLFDPQRKQALPFLPRHIALVTSPTGAALQDMLRVFRMRFPVRLTVCPAAVQGAEAPAQLAAALERADRLGADLIITGRGGGSLEDLWAFNTEVVARAIAATQTPIISAVGHEIDVTIADLVADMRAPTPTAAAQMAVPLREELIERRMVLNTRLQRAGQQLLRDRKTQLTLLTHRLGTPQDQINRCRMRLDDLPVRLTELLRAQLARRRRRLQEVQARLALHHPQLRISHYRAQWTAHCVALERLGALAVNTRRSQLLQHLAALDALSPLAILGRGYSLVFSPTGDLLRDAQQTRPQQTLRIRLHRGELRCRVEETLPIGDNQTARTATADEKNW